MSIAPPFDKGSVSPAANPHGVTRALLAGTLGGWLCAFVANVPVRTMASALLRGKGDLHVPMMDIARSHPAEFLAYVLLGSSLASSLAWGLARWEGDARNRLGLVPADLSANQWALALLSFASLKVLLLGVQVLMSARVHLPGATPEFADAPATSLAAAIRLIALGGLGSALWEELLFRGFVQRGLATRWSPLAAIGSAAFLSVAFHGWPRALMSLPASLFLGWVAWRSRSTWPPLILHTVGTTAVLGALYAGGGYWRWSAGLTYGDVFILLGFGAVATLLGMRRLARSLSRRDSSRAIGASAAPPSGP